MPGRILVVDDDPVTGRFLTNLLGDCGGFDVACTTDPASALQRASTETWDLVLTDVEMPRMSGLELLQALRRAAPDLPVVVITGHATLDYAVSALRDHADEFLPKSMPKDILLATIGAVVAKGRAARLASRQAVLQGQPAGPAPGMAAASPDSEATGAPGGTTRPAAGPPESAGATHAHPEVPHGAR
jgi:DNA-binding NtrC family response regulator